MVVYHNQFVNTCVMTMAQYCTIFFTHLQPSTRHAIESINSTICVQGLDDSQSLRFASVIAFCHALHRCSNQVIHRQMLSFHYFFFLDTVCFHNIQPKYWCVTFVDHIHVLAPVVTVHSEATSHHITQVQSNMQSTSSIFD